MFNLEEPAVNYGGGGGPMPRASMPRPALPEVEAVEDEGFQWNAAGQGALQYGATGVATGASIGTAITPGFGTAVGAAIGGGIGVVGGALVGGYS